MGNPMKRSTVLVWVGLFLGLFGLAFASAGWLSISHELAYLSEGKTVDGIVLGKSIDESWSSDHKTKSVYHVVRYRFTPEDGTEMNSSSNVVSEIYDEIEEGMTIPIEYLTSDFTKNRAKEDSEIFQNRDARSPKYTVGIVFLSIGSVILLAGLGVLTYEIRTRRTIGRLMREGMLVEANIESVEPGNLCINNVRQWRVEYTFRDMRGIEQKGVSPHISPEEAQNYQPGEKAKVRYDKNNSAINLLMSA